MVAICSRQFKTKLVRFHPGNLLLLSALIETQQRLHGRRRGAADLEEEMQYLQAFFAALTWLHSHTSGVRRPHTDKTPCASRGRVDDEMM